MKRSLAIIILLLCGGWAIAQDSIPPRSTKSYLIADYSDKDTAFLKEKCRQANMVLGLSVLANRVPTDSKWVSPKPSKHLLKQGVLHLQLPVNETQDEFAVYRSELFDIPSSINVLQIDDELITYRTMETTGNIHLLYNCRRGAFGTKKTAHAKNAPVYKLWDTPERTLLPDVELQDQMVQAEAKRLAKTKYDLLIFNDLKSYAYNNQGDTAIGHFLDTMHKYNPEKLLQADLLTPASWHYLCRVNEGQVWNESMRTKIIETLSEKQNYYNESQMSWMIGNFPILLADKKRKATSLEELEWFLSKAAAFDAGFGLDFNVETMRKHGLTDQFLNAINIWETLRLSGAFSETQKEQFKDPYGNWHLMQKNDSTYLIYERQTSRGYTATPTIYRCDPKSLETDRIPISEESIKPKKYKDGTFDSWGHFNGTWNWKSPYNSQLFLMIAVEGKGCISDITIITGWGDFTIIGTVKAGQYLIFDPTLDRNAIITDHNFNTIDRAKIDMPRRLMEGDNPITFSCSFVGEKDKIPEVTIRYIVMDENHPETIVLDPTSISASRVP